MFLFLICSLDNNFDVNFIICTLSNNFSPGYLFGYLLKQIKKISSVYIYITFFLCIHTFHFLCIGDNNTKIACAAQDLFEYINRLKSSLGNGLNLFYKIIKTEEKQSLM